MGEILVNQSSMDKNDIIGIFTGLALIFLWIIFYSYLTKLLGSGVVFLAGLFMSFNFICLNIYWLAYSNNRLLFLIYLGLYIIYFGSLGAILSAVANNWLIIPLMLVPILNVFAYCGVALWLGIIGLSEVAINTLIHSSVLNAPFFIVPLTQRLGRLADVKLKNLELRIIEKRIKELEEILNRHEDFLIQKNNIEGRVNNIISIDTANFSIKATMFRKYARTMAFGQIQTRMTELDRELQRLFAIKKQAEAKLSAIENEIGTLEHRLRDITNRLHILEATDPANIKLKMQKLLSEWEGITQQELQKIRPAGELETLFKEKLLLGFQMKAKFEEIENQRKEITHLNLTENALQLEKYSLEIEKMDRKIKDEEPRLFELKDKLTNLQIKRDKIKQYLQQK